LAASLGPADLPAAREAMRKLLRALREAAGESPL